MRIVEIVKKHGPITGEEIASKLDLTRATLRPDLAILTMSGILDARPRVGYYYSGKSSQALIADELKRIKVDEIKSMPIVIKESTSVYDAIVTMFIEDVGSLYVVDVEGGLTGVVSRKDLLRQSLGQGDLHKMPVSVIMTRMPNIVTVEPHETAYEAARKIIEHEVDGLPVVKKTGKPDGKDKLEVVGRFTKTNITKLFVELSEGI
ncbi:helix-turn-helix transcriptional regulator [Zhaonella formicivorans]|jgi:CBS domain-containing protein|uniref:helix-turn-helix transcriptional regulator n=1 Tax=Zhaonella formicivorans TaxID=2528593 RepID=UPI001D0FC200|nr:helix-turn-helix transcriptional regulator [Zhaonella formicivorans]